jgi:hypothetical protein
MGGREMRIISMKTQWRLIRFIVYMSENVRPSTFNGTTTEQFNKFDKFTEEVTDLVYRIGGLKGLICIEKALGISSNPEFTEEQK